MDTGKHARAAQLPSCCNCCAGAAGPAASASGCNNPPAAPCCVPVPPQAPAVHAAGDAQALLAPPPLPRAAAGPQLHLAACRCRRRLQQCMLQVMPRRCWPRRHCRWLLQAPSCTALRAEATGGSAVHVAGAVHALLAPPPVPLTAAGPQVHRAACRCRRWLSRACRSCSAGAAGPAACAADCSSQLSAAGCVPVPPLAQPRMPQLFCRRRRSRRLCR
jgi:hypothetical protein